MEVQSIRTTVISTLLTSATEVFNGGNLIAIGSFYYRIIITTLAVRTITFLASSIVEIIYRFLNFAFGASFSLDRANHFYPLSASNSAD